MCGCLLYQMLNIQWKMPTYLRKAREAKRKSETEILLLSSSCAGQLNPYRQPLQQQLTPWHYTAL